MRPASSQSFPENNASNLGKNLTDKNSSRFQELPKTKTDKHINHPQIHLGLLEIEHICRKVPELRELPNTKKQKQESNTPQKHIATIWNSWKSGLLSESLFFHNTFLFFVSDFAQGHPCNTNSHNNNDGFTWIGSSSHSYSKNKHSSNKMTVVIVLTIIVAVLIVVFFIVKIPSP